MNERDPLWLKVELVFHDGTRCDGCEHLMTWTEYHGPGLREPMAECHLIEMGSDPTQCPGLGAEETT